MQDQLREAYASGALHKLGAKDIEENKKWGSTNNIRLNPLHAERHISINGVKFSFSLSQGAEIPMEQVKDGLILDSVNGRWKLEGHNTADWSIDKPWYNSVNSIEGTASSSPTLQTSLWGALKRMGEKLKTVEAAKKRLVKTEKDLRDELEKPFESANRLNEQREKLSSVLAELEKTGDAAQTSAPSMDGISEDFPHFAYLTRQIAAEGSDKLVEKFQKQDLESRKNTFYIRTPDGFSPQKRAKSIKLSGFKGIEFFYTEDKKKSILNVYEASSGIRVGSGKTLNSAKDNSEKTLSERGEQALLDYFKEEGLKYGLSPRTQAIDADTTSLFEGLEVGNLVAFTRDKERYTGPIKTIKQDTGEIEIDTPDRLLVIPVRFIEQATQEDQAKYLALQKESSETSRQSIAPGFVDQPITEDDAESAVLEALGVEELPENIEFLSDPNLIKGSVSFHEGELPQVTINLAKHDSSESVKDTLIHELLHPVQENPALANAVGAVADMVSASDLARKQALGYNAAETPIEAANELIRKFYADHAQSNRFKRSIDNVIIWVKRALGVDLTARQAAIWLVRDAVKNNISTATGEAKSIGEVRPEDVGGGTVGAVFEKAISEEFNRPTEFAEADVADDAAAIRGGAYTAAELAEIGLPTVEFETEKHTRMLEGSAWESADEETGGRLLQKHQFLMDHSQEMFPNDAERAAVLGNWVNSLRNILGTMAERRANGMPVPFSEALQDELRGYVQAEARFWGQLLNSLRGVSKSILWAATSSGAKLRTMRSEAFGGQAVNQYLQLIKEHFQETWTDDQIDSLVRETNLLNRLRPVHEITSKQAVKLVRDTLRTPVRHVDEFAEVFSELFAAQFGIPVSPRVAEVFKTAVGKRLTKALKMSKEGAWARLDKKVKKALNKRSPLWRRISRLLDDGDLDFDKAIEAIARREGWVVPTIEDIDQFKALAARERELRTLKPDVIENIDKLPKSKRAAEKRRLQDELEAATDTSRSDIIKRMNNTWSRWTRPISWAAYLPWKFRLETVQNNAQAVNEWITANLLLKFGFAVRQVIDVGVQTISHDPTRALGTAMLTHQDDFAKGVFTPAFWADAGSALSTALRLRIKTTKHAIAAAKQALKGKGVIKHSEQVTNRLDIFERMLRKAEKLSDEGKNVQAFGLRLAAWMRSALLFSRAMDLLSTTGATYVEIAHRIRISMREQGKSRAEIEVQLDGIFGNMRAQWIDAYARAEQVFAAYGEDPNKADLDNAAGNIMRSRAYGALKIIDSKSDDFKSVAEYMASTIGWNEREAAGIGGMVAGILRTVQRGGESIGVPTAFISAFGNAIGIGINRKLTWMGLGKFAQINGQNPWFRTELDQQQRQVEGFIGAGLSSVLVALVMTGAIVVRGFWPRDEKEREKWRIEGRRPGTIEIPTGEDGEFFAVSLSVGPAALVAPSLVAAGELKKKIDEQTEKQAKLDADAKKRGMKPGKVDPLNAADMLEVAGSAMWASLMNSRTAGGLAGAFMQEGLFETKRFGATIVTDVTPGLPAWKDAMRAAGVYMNGRLATFGDMIFPTPWSGARRVTVLGDPSGSFDQVQQIVQTLSGGTAPGKVNPRLARNKPAYEALFSANWVPSPPNPARGYAIDRVYRPLTRPEMQRYTGLRADFFAKALAPVAPQIIALPQEQGEKIARKAFEDANNRALTAIGVDVQASSAPSSRPKSSQTIQVGKPISFRPRLSRPRLSRAVPKSPFGKLPGLSAVPSLKPVPVPRGATSPRLRTSRIRKPRVRKPSSSVKVRRGSLRRRVRLPRATVSRRR